MLFAGNFLYTLFYPFKMVTRTKHGLFLQDTLCGLLTSKYDVHIEKSEIIKHALADYNGVTVFSSHTSFKDILATDYALRSMGERFPVFVLRNDLRFIISRSITQKLLVDDCKGIGLDQKTMHLSEVMPKLKEAYSDNHMVVIYPGATRKGGYLNGLIPTSVSLFMNQIKRHGFKKQAFVPLAVRYLGTDITLCFGGVLSLDAHSNARETGNEMYERILTCAQHPKEVIASYIKAHS